MSPLNRLAQPLNVGDVQLPNRVVLAPMSGVSDRPFREVAAAHGAGAVVSEMIASDQLASAQPVAVLKAERAGDGPHIVQLAGREAHWMAEGARAATDAGADIIDINMGCPARKVTHGYSGSALMRDLDHALALIEATVAATPRPVTLKMRLGWDHRSLNAADLAARAENAGIRLITVHGRTRCQFFKGHANWRAVAVVKDAVRIPLLVNGDIDTLDDLAEALLVSGADGVMTGRGAYGRPWWPGDAARFATTGQPAERLSGSALMDVVADHYRAILGHYGDAIGLRAARKHLGWYLDRAATTGTDPIERRAILTETDPRAVLQRMSRALDSQAARQAA